MVTRGWLDELIPSDAHNRIQLLLPALISRHWLLVLLWLIQATSQPNIHVSLVLVPTNTPQNSTAPRGGTCVSFSEPHLNLFVLDIMVKMILCEWREREKLFFRTQHKLLRLAHLGWNCFSYVWCKLTLLFRYFKASWAPTNLNL
jgi:hypothetical protein